MAIYDFDNIISRRGTGSVKWSRCSEEQIPMFIADMDFASPPAVCDRIKQRGQHPVYGYTFPDEELFSAFRQWFEESYSYQTPAEWLGVLPGIVPVLSLASNIRGGAILVNTPVYPPFLKGPVKAGNQVLASPLKWEDGAYHLDFTDLEKQAAQGATTFYLCNPHNPVGRVYTRKELEELSRFAKKHNLMIISDEIHCELVYDREHIPFLTVDDYAREHSVTLMGPGKTCNIPGLGLAFSIIPNEELRKDFQQTTYMLPHPGIFGIEGALGAYAKETRVWKRELTVYLKENRDYLEAELEKRFPKAVFAHTEGTYLQWIDFRPYGIAHPATWLREEAGILLNDGKDFGAEGYVRLNFGCPRSRIVTALERIGAALTRRR